ncbi:hypothetical protein [Nonomuraea sp. NPDC050783]|uniref:hypothetical protein n=1 Tax=Nonomuraea sp. NPDC050783 TaxID=3154634 RepID=UPI003464FB45
MAPVKMTASGMPVASVIRWCLLPDAAGGLLGGLLGLARGLGAAFGQLGAGVGLGFLAAGLVGVGTGGAGLGQRVGDGLVQIGAQSGRRGGQLVGQRPEHGAGLFQPDLSAVAGGGRGRDPLAVETAAVVVAAVQRVGQGRRGGCG